MYTHRLTFIYINVHCWANRAYAYSIERIYTYRSTWSEHRYKYASDDECLSSPPPSHARSCRHTKRYLRTLTEGGEIIYKLKVRALNTVLLCNSPKLYPREPSKRWVLARYLYTLDFCSANDIIIAWKGSITRVRALRAVYGRGE